MNAIRKVRACFLIGAVGLFPLALWRARTSRPPVEEGEGPRVLTGMPIPNPSPAWGPVSLADDPTEAPMVPRAEADARNRAIHRILASTTVGGTSETITLNLLLVVVRTGSWVEDLPEGLQFYVDPLALQERGLTMKSELTISGSRPQNRGALLRLALASRGLAYAVRDGRLEISTPEALKPLALDDWEETRDVARRLGRSASRTLEDGTKLPRAGERITLQDLIRYVREATRPETGGEGIAVAYDTDGLMEAGIVVDRPIVLGGPFLDLEDVLRKTLEPIGLDFAVREGVILISSKGGIEQAVRDALR